MASIEDAPADSQPEPTSQANTGVASNEAGVPQNIPQAQPQSANQGLSSAAEVDDTAATDVQTQKLLENPDALKSGDKSVPPATFLDSFKLSMTPEEAWQKLSEKWTTIDKEMVEGWREDLNNLLIFAGLFSAVVTTFVVDSYKGLQADPATTTNLLLAQISMQLVSFTTNQGFINSTAALNSSLADAINSTPSSPVKQVNALWFASLIFSLGVASVAILVRQWLREFLRMPIANHQASVYTRQWRRDGLEHWKVAEIIATLPVLMEVALALFFIGLVQQLLFLDSVVGGIVTALIATTLLFLVATSVLPAFSDQCSYRSPQAWALKQILHGVAIPILISAERCLYLLGSAQERSEQATGNVSRNAEASTLQDFPGNLYQTVNNMSRQLKSCIGQPWEWQESKLYKSHDQQTLKLDILQKTINMFPDDDDIPQALSRFLTEIASSVDESLTQLDSLISLSQSEKDTMVYAEPHAWKLYLYIIGNILQQSQLQDDSSAIFTTLYYLDSVLEQFMDLNDSTPSASLPVTAVFYHSLLLPLIVDLCPVLKSCIKSHQNLQPINQNIYNILNKFSRFFQSESTILLLRESGITISVLQVEYSFENSSLSRWLSFNIAKQYSVLFITKAELGILREFNISDQGQRLDITLLHSLNHNSSTVCCVQFSPDGKSIAVVLKNKVIIYNAQIGVPIWETDHSQIYSVSFHPSGKYLAIGGISKKIQIWNITTQKIHKILLDHRGSVYDLQYSLNEQFLVSASANKTVRIWNLSDDESKESLILQHSNYVFSVSISPNSQLVATVCLDYNIYLWSSQTGHKLECLKGHTSQIGSIAFTSDEKQLISGGYDKTIKYWNISSINSIKLEVDDTGNQTPAMSGSHKGTVGGAQCMRTLEGHTDWIRSIAVSPNGKWIVSGSDDRTVKFWDAKTGVTQCTLKGYKGSVSSVDLDSSETLLATGDAYGTVHIWRYEEYDIEDSEYIPE